MADELAGISRLTPVDFDPFRDELPITTLPLTGPQREMWAAVQMGEAASCAYNQCFVLRLRGDLSHESLLNALHVTVQRHAALRVTMSHNGESQTVLDTVDTVLPLIDLSQASPADRAERVDRILSDETGTPFDLAAGPLLRACLIKESAELHIFVVTLHHIVCDGWSSSVFFADLCAAYAADRFGLQPKLPAAVDYAEYILDVTGDAAQEAARVDEDYWVGRYGDTAPVLDLPLDHPRPAFKSYASASCALRIDEATYKGLKGVGARNGSTLFVVLLGAFQGLLARLSGQNRFALGIPMAGQALLADGHLVGHCVSTVPLLCNVDTREAFAKHLRKVRGDFLDAQAHQRMTFGNLVQRLKIARDPSRTPLVTVIFNIDRLGAPPAFGDVVLESLATPKRFGNFEIAINAVDSGHDLLVECDYNSDLFDAATIGRWLGHYYQFLKGIVENPDRDIGAMELLTPAERQELKDWNTTATPQHCDHCFPQLFDAQARRTPEAIAVVFENASLTYRQLDEQANRLASYLRKQGVGHETPVAVCMDRSPEVVVALLGILKAGGVYLPLDPSYPRERLAFMLDDAKPAILLTMSAQIDVLPAFAGRKVVLDADRTMLDRESGQPFASSITPESLAYIIYTSGSTGLPKGVMVPHRGLSNLVGAQTRGFGVTAENRVLQFAALGFDAALSEVGMALTTGATLYLAGRETLMSIDALTQLIREKGIDTITLPPSFLAALDPRTLPGLRIVISAGESCGWETALRWAAGRKFFNAYGPTETSIGPTFYRVEQREPGASTVPIGRPIENMYIHILDAQRELVPVGIPGEIHIGGVGLARGYLNRPDLTAEKFVTDPFDPARRLYKSGDLARWLPNGTIEYLGRIDHQVKLRGYRIELGEIEAALVEHPEVSESVVMVREDSPGIKRLVGYVKAKVAADSLGDRLRTHVRRTLPEYMVPAVVVVVDSWPLTPNGKIDRKALPPPEWKDAPEKKIAPRTAAERTLLEVWKAILQVGHLGVEDNFFDLGGDSITAARIMARLREISGVNLPLRHLFERPTIAGLAEVLDAMSLTQVPASSGRDGDEREEFEL